MISVEHSFWLYVELKKSKIEWSLYEGIFDECEIYHIPSEHLWSKWKLKNLGIMKWNIPDCFTYNFKLKSRSGPEAVW